MAGIVLKPRARILHGHDWVFSSEVLKVFGNPTDGDVVSLKDGKDRLIGSAIYNSKSQIVARRFSRRRQDLDLDFFRRRIAQASDYRDRRKVDLLHGQKTGFYLDQRYNYGTVAGYARDRRVLDCFANQGAFALTCALAGAADVTAVEENRENIDSGKRNAAHNELKAQWIEQDVFQFLRAAEKAEAQYDLIVLDPPSFTRTKSGLRDALRGYRELHMRAFKLLSKDGLLATFSCSHHVSDAAFSDTIADALVDARRSARRLRHFEQALDHPVLPTIPETEYFKGFLLEMMPGR